MRSFDESLPMALLQARETTMRRFRPLLAAHELTEQQWRVLRALAAADAPLQVGELADHTFLLAPSLSRILSTLEGRGFVARTTAQHDQRRANITLTTDGLRLVRKVAPTSEEAYGALEAAFGADRLRELLAELHALADLDLSHAKEAAS
ncbi:MAG: homoprotocatechuate degradation operon regulator HpaR [Acidimicrobiales bacterium]|nr:homoprotocatechuate degradation operon regulator HpaR [Acidimicrobiales bacterium]